MNKSLDTIMDSISNGTASEQFIIEKSLSDVVKKHAREALTISTDLKVLNVTYNFEKRYEKFKATIMSTLTSSEFDLNYNISMRTKLELITSIDLKQTGDEVGDPYYSGLDFLPDGRLVVVDKENGKCLIYDENLNVQTSCESPYARGIVSVSNEEVIIISGKCLKLDILHISDTNKITLKRRYEIKALCDTISIKDDENFVVSCLNDKVPLRLVSKYGEEKTFHIKFPSKKYCSDSGFCTYIPGQDKLVMSDSDDDTIFIYDTKTGEKIVVVDELIKAPCDVAVGPCDHVLVCSEDTNSIVEITPGGRVLFSHQLKMAYPHSLAVSKDRRRLAVFNIETGACKLALYKLTSV